MADTLDEISGGRFTLGIGAGHHQPEYDAFGFPYDHRMGRFEESITIIHELVRGGRANYTGKFYWVRDCELRPRGPLAGDIPILVGALSTSRRLLRLTAQFADIVDIWVSATENQLEGVMRAQEVIDDACRSVGRDPSTLVRTAGVLVDMPGRNGTPGVNLRPTPLTGSPPQLANALAEYARVGISEVHIYLDPCDISGVEDFSRVLDSLEQVEA
jgi:alkanesulfonate monooxygenase SsuD/methylene tetrahydromethanopterin reductase-like flavin-dependent oxidoreductase (luciferase family)